MKHCVVEIQDSVVCSLRICKDEDEAQKLFTDIARDQTDLTEDEIKMAINDGVAYVGEGSVCLCQA